jgi:heme ABC exporter ATP-binding subunit CcmA
MKKAERLISVQGLGKVFGRALVLDGVTIDLGPGEAVALLGANGAGKSTLLKILATLSRPTRGTAVVAGFDCVKDADGVRQNVGLLAHASYLYDDLTAVENLRFWTALGGQPVSSREATTALGQVELDSFADERVRGFSAGMKRRLSLARLALRRPRVLLLDEPFSGLDQRARKWLEEHLRAFKEGGGAMLMTTHSFARDLGAVDRVAILAGGRIALDTSRGLLAPGDLQRLYALHTEEAT